MKVIWKGSIELESGVNKITLVVPEGADDELHLIKKAVKRGEEIALVVMAQVDIPAWEFDQIIPICRMIEESRQKMYEKGISDAMNAQSDVSEAMEKTLEEGGTQNVT